MKNTAAYFVFFTLISSDCVLIFDWQVILSLYTIGVLFQDSSVNLSRTTRLSHGFSLYQKCARRILRQTLFLRRMAELIAQAALSAVRAVSLLGNDESGLPQLSQGPAHRGLRKLQLFRYRRDRGPALVLRIRTIRKVKIHCYRPVRQFASVQEIKPAHLLFLPVLYPANSAYVAEPSAQKFFPRPCACLKR